MYLKNPKFKQIARSGFALIITISLMVLLSLLAVGLLGLSVVNLRTTSNGAAMAEARSNARLALMLALNDLQTNAGPDTRITAPAGTLGDEIPQPSLTGVWNSRKLDPDSPDRDADLSDSAKAGDFRRWLVSTKDAQSAEQQDFGKQAAPASDTSRIMLSKQYSVDGNSEFRVDSVRVQSTPDSSSLIGGRLAYAVFDEGTKARVDLGVKSGGSELATRGEALGSGQRPHIDRMNGITAVADDAVDLTTSTGAALISKMITMGNAEMANGAPNSSFKPHFNDLTTCSLGLMTDVARGGLKKDLNLLADHSSSPPEGYGSGTHIYEDALGLRIPSAPTWQSALEFANLFNGRNSRRRPYLTSGSGGPPTLAASAPGDWSASNSVSGNVAVPNPQPPTSPVLLPSIAKVQMVYSLHVHDLWYFPPGITPNASTFQNGPFTKEWKSQPGNMWDTTNWSFKNKDREINYQLWVFCTPIITLHNPYNVAMEIPSGDLKINFVNVPFAMRIYVNGEPQTTEMVPYTDMFYWNDKGNERRYTLTIYNKSVSGGEVSIDKREAIRLLPGEVKVFSPYMNPNVRYTDRGKDNDWYNVYNDQTADISAVPGWLGEGIGYGQDQPLPAKYNPMRLQVDNQGHVIGNGRMMQDGMPLTGDEEIHVEFAPLPDPDQPEKRFTIEMTLNRANRLTSARSVVLDFDYETTDGLQKVMLGDDGKIRWPSEGTMLASDMRDHWNTPLAGFENIRPFALLSAYAKTTHGGVDETNDDGRYPAKPWIFNNHSGAVSEQKIVSQHPSHHSHEINLVRLPGHTEEAIDIQPGTDRGSFVTGHTVFNGRRFGTMLDIPLGPIQSPVSLNGANLAAGYYLPRFTAPIGNSFAHPVMSSDSLIESVNGQTYADHSYLLNSVLFDSYYCSGFQERGGPSGDGIGTKSLAETFFDGSRWLSDPRFIPFFPDGTTADDAVDAISADDGYKQVAAYQLLKGAFNVNSTSVDAWKAALSAMTGANGAVSTIPLGSGNSEGIVDLDDPDDSKGARFSRFRLPNSQPDSGDPDALWHGPRDLTSKELDRLANEIVKEVKERGPFLSMSEFVNRRIGPSSERTLAGALQTAIDRSKINDTALSLGGYEIDSGRLADLELRTPNALLGPSAQGAPGAVTQADILSLLGNSATVRSDTFLVRGYGESVGSDGSVRARAWCEAVVQRLPEYVDPADASTVFPGDLTSDANKRFGRRFEIVSFRWLNKEEV